MSAWMSPSACSSDLISSAQRVLHFVRQELVLAVIVHRFDQRLEALIHLAALHLAGRRHRLAFLLGIELFWQDTEVLDLLGAGELGIGLIDLAPDQPSHFGMLAKP